MAQKNHTKTLILTSIMMALIFLITYLLPFRIPGTSAYVNLGDSMIYSTGIFVAAPWAAVASGLGSMLSDLALGVPIYAPATLVIKGLMGFVCALLIQLGRRRANQMEPAVSAQKKKGIGFGWFILGCVAGGAIMVVGYGVYEYFIMGGWSYVAVTIIPNLIQWAAGVAGALILYYPLNMVRKTIR